MTATAVIKLGMSNFKRAVYGLPFLSPLRKRRALKAFGRMKLVADGFEIGTREDMYSSAWERPEREAVRRLLPSCVGLLDIGANHGFYTLLALHLGKPAIAIEPEAVNLSILRKNVGHKAKIIPAAVSDFCGNLTIYGDGDMASISSAWQGTARHFRQKVPAITLDSIETWPGKLFIKVDVEGAEDAVLRGATETLKRDAVC